MTNKPRPIIITIKENEEDEGVKYTLEFSRNTAIFTDAAGFRISQFEDRLTEMLPILFYGAFRMHHKKMSKADTDDILFNKLGGLSPEVVKRLAELYGATREALIHEADEDDEKNALATVEL